MSVSLVVAFRPDGAERDRNWAWLRTRYERLYPDWEIVERSDGNAGPWCKGRAVNAAAEAASGDVLIVADADVLVGADVLPHAVAQLEHAAWVVPHGSVYRLNEKATAALISEELRADPHRLERRQLQRGVRRGPAGGGLAVAHHDDFQRAGGLDERFTEWGGEDISFARAMDTLVGTHLRLGEIAWHLCHPTVRPEDGRASEANERLAARYLEASGDPVEMAKLCEQPPYEGLAGGGIVVAPKEVIRSTPLDARFSGWG